MELPGLTVFRTRRRRATRPYREDHTTLVYCIVNPIPSHPSHLSLPFSDLSQLLPPTPTPPTTTLPSTSTSAIEGPRLCTAARPTSSSIVFPLSRYNVPLVQDYPNLKPGHPHSLPTRYGTALDRRLQYLHLRSLSQHSTCAGCGPLIYKTTMYEYLGVTTSR